MPAATIELLDDDYVRLAELRHGLRSFLHWSAEEAKRVGLTPAQHQLLLAIRAARDPRGPTVTEAAEVLLIRHHSAVELVDRAQHADLITRHRDPDQHSLVRLRLTAHGAERLRSLAEVHMRELSQLAPTMQALWRAVAEDDRPPAS
jgi:DNA-binding MarR family transcriptional regulator